jgi:hypothetical protein
MSEDSSFDHLGDYAPMAKVFDKMIIPELCGKAFTVWRYELEPVRERDPEHEYHFALMTGDPVEQERVLPAGTGDFFRPSRVLNQRHFFYIAEDSLILVLDVRLVIGRGIFVKCLVMATAEIGWLRLSGYAGLDTALCDPVSKHQIFSDTIFTSRVMILTNPRNYGTP